MSKIYALVDVDTGEVGTVAHLNSALHADGDSLSDEIFVKDIDNESDPDSFITAKYWTGSAWADKPEKPGEYYKIKNWVDTFMQIPFGIYKFNSKVF